MRLPPESLHREAEPLGSGSPLSWGPAGSPPRREPAGTVVIPARAAAPAHKASAQGRALVFERSQNRAWAEPPLRLRGAWSPTAVPGGHRGPLGGGLENGDVPGLLTSSPMPCHHLLRPSPGGPTVSLCRGSVEPAGGDRDPQPPCAPGAPGQKSPRGAVGKGSSGARLRACCAPAPTSVGAGGAELLCPRRMRPQPQRDLPGPPAGDAGPDPANRGCRDTSCTGKSTRIPPKPLWGAGKRGQSTRGAGPHGSRP